MRIPLLPSKRGGILIEEGPPLRLKLIFLERRVCLLSWFRLFLAPRIAILRILFEHLK